jgi:hypothetical protein
MRSLGAALRLPCRGGGVTRCRGERGEVVNRCIGAADVTLWRGWAAGGISMSEDLETSGSKRSRPLLEELS